MKLVIDGEHMAVSEVGVHDIEDICPEVTGIHFKNFIVRSGAPILKIKVNYQSSVTK